MSKVWQDCLKTLQETLPIQDYTRWVAPIIAKQGKNTLNIVTPTPQTLIWVNNNIKITIISLVHQIDSNIQVKISTKKQNNPISTLVTKLSTPLTEDYTFENLILGDANQFAYHASKQITKNITTCEYSPFIIYGKSGTGKTHLLQATGHEIKKNNPQTNVIYTTLMDFVKGITNGIRHNHIETIKKCYQSADLLLIDDIHMIAEKNKTQEEFFHIFNFLFQKKKQIILTCDQIPKNIKKIEARILTRLNQGLSLQITPPELEMRSAILMNKSEALDIPLTEEIALFIASKMTENVRELEGALRRIKASISFSGLKATQLDINQIQNILGDLINHQNKIIDIIDIQKTVCHYFGISVSSLVSKKRTKDLVYPRQLAMYLSKELTNLSLTEIGINFKRDHTTIIHAYQKTKTLLQSNQTTQEDYKNLKIKLNSI